ncbi:GNAT family N-acetyltransferase [Janibacter alittae]|uniref:GNAT family N-acetyltransferase n=1 Tax=Janibacter alittae TaxID=3115209 RepID=A0ABZ2MDP5_9MICO
MSSFDFLATERLLLPPLSVEDTDALVAVYSDPQVPRYVGGDRLTPEAIGLQVADFTHEWQERGYGQSAVIRRENGRFLGRIGLHFWPNWGETELGYVLSREAQGQGLATEGCRAWIDWARRDRTIRSLIANIHPENTASIHLATKLGFTFDRNDQTPSGVPTLIFRLDV